MVAGGFRATTDESEVGAAGRHRDLRADPAVGGRRPRPDRGAGRTETAGRLLQPRHAGGRWSRPPTRAPPTRSSGPMLEKASGLSAGVDFHLAFSPERIDPGNPVYGLAEHPQGRRRPHPGLHRRRRRGSTARSATRWSRPSRPRGRDGQAAGEHLPARQHRAGQRDGRSSATSSASTCGTRSAARPPSRSASSRSTRAPASAGTASPSTRTTCPTRSARWVTRSASSSWPRRSTAGCRATSSTAPPSCSTGTPSRSTAPRCCCSGVTYKQDIADQRESPGPADRPQAAAPAAPCSPTTTRTCRTGRSTASRCAAAADLDADVADRRPGHPAAGAQRVRPGADRRRGPAAASTPAASWPPAGRAVSPGIETL